MGPRPVEAFSDGVMAVATTLLVLDLHTSAASSQSLLAQLATSWPTFFASVVSFFVVGTIWVNHHLLFNAIVVVDRFILALNLVLLSSTRAALKGNLNCTRSVSCPIHPT